MHWRGLAIFNDLNVRNDWLAAFRSYLDTTVNVVEAPDPVSEYPDGIVTWANKVGNALTGSAFTWSLRVPELEYGDDSTSPPTSGPAKILNDQLNDLGDLDPNATEVGSGFQ